MKYYIAHEFGDRIHEEDEKPVSIEGVEQLENSSCELISLNNSLDYSQFRDRDPILNLVATKIRYGGAIELKGTDILAASQNVNDYILNVEEANHVIFDGKRSLSSVQHITKQLKSLNLDIDMIKLDGFRYFIRAKRPGPNE